MMKGRSLGVARPKLSRPMVNSAACCCLRRHAVQDIAPYATGGKDSMGRPQVRVGQTDPAKWRRSARLVGRSQASRYKEGREADRQASAFGASRSLRGLPANLLIEREADAQ